MYVGDNECVLYCIMLVLYIMYLDVILLSGAVRITVILIFSPDVDTSGTFTCYRHPYLISDL